MKKDNENKSLIIVFLICILSVIWVGLKIAPSVNGGLVTILPCLLKIFDNPFRIELCEDSLRTVLVLLLAYGLGIGVFFSTRRNYRHREEHGSAKWGNARKINKKYMQKPESDNKIMSNSVKVGLNGKKHRRNLNTLICGGSGSGKTRFYAKPNLMQANTSFVVLDPKGKEVLGYILQAVH